MHIFSDIFNFNHIAKLWGPRNRKVPLKTLVENVNLTARKELKATILVLISFRMRGFLNVQKLYFYLQNRYICQTYTYLTKYKLCLLNIQKFHGDVASGVIKM